MDGDRSPRDRFEVIKEIGSGGFGVVYKAYDRKMEREVALKRLTIASADADLLLREQRAIAPLSTHPNIVTLYETVPEGDGGPCLVFELCAGNYDGPRSWTEILDIGIRLAGALATAHQDNTIHCDIKPDNVLVSIHGVPELADFGTARLLDRSVRWQVQGGLTPNYSAPEVRTCQQQADRLADVWSLGRTLDAMLRTDPSAGCSALRQVLEHATAEDRLDRTPSAIALASELQAVQRTFRIPVTLFPVADTVDLGPLRSKVATTTFPGPDDQAGTTQPAGPPPAPQPQPGPARSRRPRRAIGAVASLALLGGAGALLVSRPWDQPAAGSPGQLSETSTANPATALNVTQGTETGVLSGTSPVDNNDTTPGTVATAPSGSVIFTSDRGSGLAPYRLELTSGEVGAMTAAMTGATEAVLSPDEQQVAAILVRDGRRVLAVADHDASDASDARVVEQERDAASPTWSPDSHSIAFATNRNGSWDIWVHDDATGRSEPLVAGSADETQPAWGPDGKLALTSTQSGDGKIYVFDMSSRELTAVSATGRAQADPSWNPDGTQLVYSAEIDSGRSLFLTDLATSETRRLTAAAGSDRDPAFTADGRHVVFVSDVDGDQELFIISLDTEQRTRLTANAGADAAPTVI